MTAPRRSPLASQYVDARQELETSRLGMWIFLMTEAMLFGGLFTAYACYRRLEVDKIYLFYKCKLWII